MIDGQGVNNYAFTQHAVGVTIEYLTIQNFVSPSARGRRQPRRRRRLDIRHNTIQHNSGAGVFLGDGAVVTYNCLLRNGQYGFSAYEPDGVRDVVLRRNEIAYNNTDDWERRRPGCGCSGGGKFWETSGARVIKNYVHHNKSVGIWADTNNTGFLVRGNYLARNDSEAILYETSYNAAFLDNTFVRNGLVSGPDNPGFPTPALYLSESGSDSRAGAATGRRSTSSAIASWTTGPACSRGRTPTASPARPPTPARATAPSSTPRSRRWRRAAIPG